MASRLRTRKFTIHTCCQRSPVNDFIETETRHFLPPDRERAPIGELRQTDLFDRSSTQALHQTAVLHDLAAAYVDTVMSMASAWRNDVCAHRRSCTWDCGGDKMSPRIPRPYPGRRRAPRIGRHEVRSPAVRGQGRGRTRVDTALNDLQLSTTKPLA